MLGGKFTDEDLDNKIYDFIVARDDGRVEIYCYMLGSAYPILCFEVLVRATITGIDIGNITLASSMDVLLTCYDGKVLSLIDTKKFKKQGIMGSEIVVT